MCTLEVRGQLAESALSLHCVGSRDGTSVMARHGHAVCFGFLKIFFAAGDSQTWVHAELFINPAVLGPLLLVTAMF